MTAPVGRFPRPLTAGQIRAIPLRDMVRPAPIGTRAVRVDTPIVQCGVCGAPVRFATVDEIVAALLADGRAPDWRHECRWHALPDGRHDCLWHGPAGVARQHPSVWPVDVCVTAPWQASPVTAVNRTREEENPQ